MPSNCHIRRLFFANIKLWLFIKLRRIQIKIIKRRCKMNSTICTFAIFQYKLHKPRVKFKLFADNLHIHIQWTAADRVSLNHFDSWMNHSDRNGFKERSEPLFTVKYMRKVNKWQTFIFGRTSPNFWLHTNGQTYLSSDKKEQWRLLLLCLVFGHDLLCDWLDELLGRLQLSLFLSI